MSINSNHLYRSQRADAHFKLKEEEGEGITNNYIPHRNAAKRIKSMVDQERIQGEEEVIVGEQATLSRAHGDLEGHKHA